MAKPKQSKKGLTPTDIENMSEADAKKLLADLTARLETPKTDDSPEVERLSAALVGAKRRNEAARRIASEAAQDAVYAVTSCIGAAVSIEVSNGRGEMKRILFDKRGATHFLTAPQLQDVKDRTEFFEKGYLSAPEAVEDSPNVIRDLDAFIDGLKVSEINSRINAIESSDILFGIYHYIEESRFVVEGTELKQVQIAPQKQMVLTAVMERLHALTGINFSATDAE